MFGSIKAAYVNWSGKQDGKLLVAALSDTNLSNPSFTKVYVS